MITVEKDNIKGLIDTLKGVMPANFEAMERLVSCVQYLEFLLSKPDEPDEEVKDG